MKEVIVEFHTRRKFIYKKRNENDFLFKFNHCKELPELKRLFENILLDNILVITENVTNLIASVVFRDKYAKSDDPVKKKTPAKGYILCSGDYLYFDSKSKILYYFFKKTTQISDIYFSHNQDLQNICK